MKISESKVQVFPGSEVIWQIGNNTLKLLMIEYRKSYLKGYLKYRASYTESFGVLLDDNFHERNISNILKKKIAKSFGLSVFTVFFKHKRTTGHKPNTHKTILKNKRSQQKHAIRLVHKKGIYYHTKEFTKYFFLHA